MKAKAAPKRCCLREETILSSKHRAPNQQTQALLNVFMRQLEHIWEAQEFSIRLNPSGERSPGAARSVRHGTAHGWAHLLTLPGAGLRTPAAVTQNAVPSSRKLRLANSPRSHTAPQLQTRDGRPPLPGPPRAPTRPDPLPPPPTRGPSGPPPGIRSAPLRGGLRHKGRDRPAAPFSMLRFLCGVRPLCSLGRSCLRSSAQRAEVPGVLREDGAGLPGAGGVQRREGRRAALCCSEPSVGWLLVLGSGRGSQLGEGGQDRWVGRGSAASSWEGIECPSPCLGSRHRCVCGSSLPSGCSERMRACRPLLRWLYHQLLKLSLSEVYWSNVL